MSRGEVEALLVVKKCVEVAIVIVEGMIAVAVDSVTNSCKYINENL